MIIEYCGDKLRKWGECIMEESSFKLQKLSESKKNELASRKFINYYNTMLGFNNPCVVSMEENIVFTAMAYSHEDDIPNQYFLHFNKWDFYVYAFRKFNGRIEKDEGIIYEYLFDISCIADVSQMEPKEYTYDDVMCSLEGGFKIWNENHSGRIGKNDHIATKIQFGGVIE